MPLWRHGNRGLVQGLFLENVLPGDEISVGQQHNKLCVFTVGRQSPGPCSRELIVMNLDQTFLIWRLLSVEGLSASQKPRGPAGKNSLHEFPTVEAAWEKVSWKNCKPSA